MNEWKGCNEKLIDVDGKIFKLYTVFELLCIFHVVKSTHFGFDPAQIHP